MLLRTSHRARAPKPTPRTRSAESSPRLVNARPLRRIRCKFKQIRSRWVLRVSRSIRDRSSGSAVTQPSSGCAIRQRASHEPETEPAARRAAPGARARPLADPPQALQFLAAHLSDVAQLVAQHATQDGRGDALQQAAWRPAGAWRGLLRCVRSTRAGQFAAAGSRTAASSCASSCFEGLRAVRADVAVGVVALRAGTGN